MESDALGIFQFLDEPLQGDDSALVSSQLVGDTVVCNGTIDDVVVVDGVLGIFVAVLQHEKCPLLAVVRIGEHLQVR